MLLNINKNLIN